MTATAPDRRSIGLASSLLHRRAAEVDRLLAEEGGVRPLSLRRRPPAGIRRIACFLDDGQAFRDRVARYARRWNLPLLTLRRGPFGALLLPPGGGRLPLLSLMVGPGQAGDLQAAVQAAQGAPASAAEDLIRRLRQLRLGLANPVPPPASPPRPADRPLILVLEEPAPFAVQQAMLAAACAENPGAEVRILPLPGLDGERRVGALQLLAASRGIAVAAGDLPSAQALAEAKVLYVYGHMLGLEALIQGVPVTCFGFPPYAGWGLTDDRGDGPVQGRVELPVLVAALLTFCRFASPYGQGRADLDLLLRHGAAVLARDSRTAGETIMVEADPARRARLRLFLEGRTGRLRFAPTIKAATRLRGRRPGSRIALWAQATTPPLPGATPLRLEEEIFAPLGLPAGLLFANVPLTGAGTATAADGDRLLALIATTAPPPAKDAGPHQICLLIPDEQGLGPDDYRALVRSARAAQPGARIITTCPLADIGADQVTALPAVSLLSEIDGLYTFAASLGFAALLRGIPVTTLGAPFYAGFGLTTDHGLPQGSDRLSLPALAAQILLDRTAYIDPASGLPCDLWTAIDRQGLRRDRPTPWLRRLLRRLRN